MYRIKLCIFLLSIITVSIFSEQKNVKNIPLPSGYSRIRLPENSFSAWLRKLPLKQTREIKKYDGSTLPSNYYNVFYVIDMPIIFTTDLEQCADYCMRFWLEFHKNILSDLYLFDYSGNKKYYIQSKKKLYEFLRISMAYSNSYSLKAGCNSIKHENAIPGDMFVQNRNGGIGHVSMIMDACEDKKGNKLYLIGFSFMPAQEFHIEKAYSPYGESGWYRLDGYIKFLSNYYNYGTPVLKRFPK